MFIFALIIILLIVFCYNFIFKTKRQLDWQAQQFRKQGYKVYQHPFKALGHPFFDLYGVTKKVDDHDGLALVKQQYPKYDVVLMNSSQKIYVQVIEPELVKTFLSTNKDLRLQKDKLEIDLMGRMMGSGLLTASGDIWKRKRKTLNELFHFNFVNNLIPRIVEICNESLEKMEKQSKATGKQFEYSIGKYAKFILSSVILESFFGKNIQGEKIEDKQISEFMVDLVNDIIWQSEDPFYWIFGKRYFDLGLKKEYRQINRKIQVYKDWGNSYVKERLEEIRSRGEGEKQQTNIIEAIESYREKGNFYPDEEIFGEFSNFFVAGVDTSYHFFSMMAYLTVMHPQVEQRVRAEIREFMEDGDYSYENLKKLVYVDCVSKETIRYYSPVNRLFSRTAEEDGYLNKVPVKKGTMLNIQTLGVHYSEKYYKDPTEFRPERWFEECNQLHTFAHNGFSGGPRTCIGKHLAQLEAKISFIKLFKRYQTIKLPVEKIKMKFGFVYDFEDFKSKLIIA